MEKNQLHIVNVTEINMGSKRLGMTTNMNRLQNHHQTQKCYCFLVVVLVYIYSGLDLVGVVVVVAAAGEVIVIQQELSLCLVPLTVHR